MFDTLSLFLNYLITTLSAAAAALCFVMYGLKRKAPYRELAVYFVLLTVLELIIRDSEMMTSLYVFVHTFFYFPMIFEKAIVYAAIVFVLFSFFNNLFLRKSKYISFVVAGVMLGWFLAFYLVQQHTVFTAWLFILPVQIFTSVIAVWGIFKLKEADGLVFRRQLRITFYGVLVFSVLTLAEDTYVFAVMSSGKIPLTASFSSIGHIVPNRNYMECFGFVFQACMVISALAPECVRQSANREEAASTSSESNREDLLMFAADNGISARETQVMELLLQGKRNSEISEILFIAPGTVKTHTHNIFQKTETNSRGELADKFHRYFIDRDNRMPD